MSNFVFVLSVLFLAPLSHAAEVCIPGTISGTMNLANPWPILEHGERHTQIQRVIAIRGANARYCTERFGELSRPIQFSVHASGVIEVDMATVQSPTAECLASMLKNVRAGVYNCDLNVPYKWDGKLPLVNAERREFR